jgi:hypothetical protein
MDFLQRGHGYTWKAISKDPVFMVLGHPSKNDHPEVVLMRDSLVVNSSDENMRNRMTRMLEVLESQAHNGTGGGL